MTERQTDPTEAAKAYLGVPTGDYDRASMVARAIQLAERIVEAGEYDPEHRQPRIQEAAATLLVRWAESDALVRELIVPPSTLEENARRFVHEALTC